MSQLKGSFADTAKPSSQTRGSTRATSGGGGGSSSSSAGKPSASPSANARQQQQQQSRNQQQQQPPTAPEEVETIVGFSASGAISSLRNASSIESELSDDTTAASVSSQQHEKSKRGAGVGQSQGREIHRNVGSGSGTGSTQRLSSIEILNENKQRQLQFKQQESFKYHLEQRQKQIQLQHQQHQHQQLHSQQRLNQTGSESHFNEPDLGLTYQVNTSAPDYMSSAVAKATAASGASKAMNPFDDQQTKSSAAHDTEAGASKSQAATLSGKSGFLSGLMDEASSDGRLADDSGEELAQHQAKDAGSRYSKVAAGCTSSYNYDEDPSRKPFYQRDFATILQDCRASRKLVILIVAIALLLDNMLLTSVVPIIPAYLYKLRIERQHRDLLLDAGNGSLAASSSGGRAPARAAQAAEAWPPPQQLDDEALEEELARRINQSLASAKDRFSGSFFHPRVRINQLTGRREDVDEDDGDDDDADDDNDGDRRKAEGRDEDEDEDEADGEASNEDSGRSPARGKVSRKGGDSDTRPQRLRSSGAKSSSLLDDEDYELNNDDEDGDGDAGRGASDNGPDKSSKQRSSRPSDRSGDSSGRRAKGQSDSTSGRSKSASELRASQQQQRKSQSTGKAENGGDLGDDKSDGDDDNNGDDEDDDEDAANSRKWSSLKSSIMSMARTKDADSGELGGMCLKMVMNGDINDNGDDNRNARRLAPNSSGQMRAESKDEDDDDNDDDDGGQSVADSRQRMRSMDPKVNKAKRPGRSPRVERIRPPLSRIPNRSKNRTADSEQSNSKGKQQQPKVVKAPGGDELIISHQDIVDESFEVGVMFASKPIVQAIANPFIGTITNRVGFTLPMFTGFVIMFLSTLVFAFGSSYTTLFMARAIQGVGSACTSVAGMSMLADRFTDDAERGQAMAIALGGLALGVVIGPPFGGFMYEFIGKSSPFIVLALLALLDGLLQLMVLQPRVSKSHEEGASLMTLIKDPYILVAAGAITFANTGIAILEPALPLWMMDTMQAKNWEQGVAFLPAAIAYLIGTNVIGKIGHKIGRWRSTMIGLITIGCSLLLIPFATRVDHLIIPNGAIGFAVGMVDSTMMPMLGYLVDIRHTSVYGSVYAIGDVAFCASFAFGPALSGTLVELIGFEGLIITTALICFCFAPLLLLLRNPPARQVDEAQLQEQSTMRYVNYNQLDSPDEEAQLTGGNQVSKTYVR